MPIDTSGRIGALAGVLALVEPTVVATAQALGLHPSRSQLIGLLVLELGLIVVAAIWFIWPWFRKHTKAGASSPRTLGVRDLSQHLRLLTPFTGTHVLLASRPDREAQDLATEIERRLLDPAGWPVMRPAVTGFSAIDDLGVERPQPDTVELGADGNAIPECLWVLARVLNDLDIRTRHSRNAGVPWPDGVLVNVQ
jgi:hypothetical protein